MPNKQYLAGRRVEYLVIKRLKEEGAVIAQRSAGSKSLIDVFALMADGKVRLIQVKKDNSPLHLEKLARLPTADNVSIELWHYHDGEFTIYR